MKEKEPNLQDVLGEEKAAFPKMAPQKTSPKKKQGDFSSPRLFSDQKRFTYTFLLEGEAASIHFDSERREIFYKGHNIRNMTLTEAQIRMLKEVVSILLEQGHRLLSEHYRASLSKLLNS